MLLSRGILYSLDKCSHQGVAHWHQYALHGAPSHRGYHVRASWRCPLRSDGVPLSHWVVHHGCTMLVEDGKEDASSWASCLDTYDTL